MSKFTLRGRSPTNQPIKTWVRRNLLVSSEGLVIPLACLQLHFCLSEKLNGVSLLFMSTNTLFLQPTCTVVVSYPSELTQNRFKCQFQHLLSSATILANHLAGHHIVFYVVKEVIENQWLVWDLTTRRQEAVQKEHALNNLCCFLLVPTGFTSIWFHEEASLRLKQAQQSLVLLLSL